MTLAGTLETTRIGTMKVKKLPRGSAQRPAKISLGYRARLEKSHHISIRLWLRTSQTESEVRNSMKLYAIAVPQANVTRKVTTRTRSNCQPFWTRAMTMRIAAHEDVRRSAPVDPPQGDQELLVDRPEQEEIEVAGAHQLGELVAVLQEQGLDQAVEGEEAADEEEVVGLGPVGDVTGAGEHRAVEGNQDPQPEDLDRDLDQEVAAEGQLAAERVAGQVPEHPKIPAEGRDEHGSPSVGAVALQPQAVEDAAEDHEDDRPGELEQQVQGTSSQPVILRRKTTAGK